MPNGSTNGATTSSPGKVTRASRYARAQLDDALALAGYAVSAGIRTPAGQPLSFGDIGVIQDTAAKLGVFDPGLTADDGAPAATPQPSITSVEWTAFERAYYRLAVAMSPVTAETLRSTEGTAPVDGATRLVLLRDQFFGYSPALRFTRMFSLVAIGFGAFVVIAECMVFVYGQDADVERHLWQRNMLQSLLPWAYGALGSCAYLLRSAHYFIYGRSFDLRRKPEYFNRVLLGAISGGAIILFVNYLVDDGSGTVLHLSSAALGFVAGYSTDFLFNTIERVVAAIFPKSDSDPKVQPPKPAAVPPPDDSGNDRPGDEAAGQPDPPDGGGNDKEDGNGDKPKQQRKSRRNKAADADQAAEPQGSR